MSDNGVVDGFGIRRWRSFDTIRFCDRILFFRFEDMGAPFSENFGRGDFCVIV